MCSPKDFHLMKWQSLGLPMRHAYGHGTGSERLQHAHHTLAQSWCVTKECMKNCQAGANDHRRTVLVECTEVARPPGMLELSWCTGTMVSLSSCKVYMYATHCICTACVLLWAQTNQLSPSLMLQLQQKFKQSARVTFQTCSHRSAGSH